MSRETLDSVEMLVVDTGTTLIGEIVRASVSITRAASVAITILLVSVLAKKFVEASAFYFISRSSN